MGSHSSVLDRTGVFASVACAVHCAIAPFLLILVPTLGGFWAHPLSHVALTALVVPVAAMALRGGFKAHGKRTILALGGLGMALVLVGTALPYLLEAPVVETAEGTLHECDDCCPTFIEDETTGERTLNIPPASIVTFAGGLSLIVAHIANLRCCAGCRTV